MSVPRLRRTVALTPRALQPVAERGDAGRRRAPRRPARRRVQRDQVDVGRRLQPAAQRGQLDGVGRPVVDAVDHRPLEAEPSAVQRQVVGARLHHGGQRVAPVDRHQLVAQRVVGGVQADGQRHREAPLGEPADAGHDADGRDRQVARRQAEVAVQPLDGAPHRGLVGQRLAHAHEHDVADAAAAVAGPPGGADDLLDDLAGRQVAGEAGLAGGAEAAPHGAAGLARHAHGGPVGVQHQHRLDAGAAGELPQELDRVAAVADRLGDRRRARAAARRRAASRSRAGRFVISGTVARRS